MCLDLAKCLLIILVVSIGFVDCRPHCNLDETCEVVRFRGFLCEQYTVNANGYILTLSRIINPLANPDTLNRYPVLYGHGLVFDSTTMIIRSDRSRPRKPLLGQPSIVYGENGTDDHSLPFMLSNNNFDVWLFDSKGTNDNNRNATFSDKFWDYSLDDQALNDLPLLIDFVLAKTASNKLVYVGFSESCFFILALLSTTPEYSDKVAAAILMAPVAYTHHIKGLTVLLLGPLAEVLPESLPTGYTPQAVINLVDLLFRVLCPHKLLSNIICGTMIEPFAGKGASQHAPDFYHNLFKSTSLKAVRHFLQLYKSNKFRMYDYGPNGNMRHYKQVSPPDYELAKIRSDRLVIARGLNDYLSTPEDTVRLIKELGVQPYKDIVIANYNHFDFIDGHHVIELLNGPLVKAIYELMYKDGPNVLKDSQQILATPGGKTTNSTFKPSPMALKTIAVLEPKGHSAAVDGIARILDYKLGDRLANVIKLLLTNRYT